MTPKVKSSADDILASESFHESSAAAAATLVKRAQSRRALAVLQARFSSSFEMLQSDHEPPHVRHPHHISSL